MKNAKINGASILIVLCMIFSGISTVVLTTNVTAGPPYGQMEVKKEVFYNGVWSEGPIAATIGQTLQFKIILTYHNTSGQPRHHYAYSIRVNDSLPKCLNYVIGSANPVATLVGADPNEYLFWDFGAAKALNDTESLIIKYNATVVNTTNNIPQVNNASVIWNEQCTGGTDLKAFDTLTITVGNAPGIDLIKKVWDPVKLDWEKSIIAYEGDTVHFKIDVINVGTINLTGVIVTDIYPEFLSPISSLPYPPTHWDQANRTIIWNLGNISALSSKVILLNESINPINMITTGKNIAKVTCNQGLNDTDNATITVNKHIIVDKKVKDPVTGQWVDEISYVKKCEPVRFRINITYFGNERMKCLVVGDILPYCLNYSDNVYIQIGSDVITPSQTAYYPDIYREGDTFQMCPGTVTVPPGGIYFSWVNQSLGAGLTYGESVIIEFDTSVIRYCESTQPCKLQNCAEAWLWGCNCDTLYHAMDCVNITCVALPGDFNKTVSPDNQTNWVKELNTVQGFYIKFKLDLTYYGNENLTNISFLDVLPCCLTYENTIQTPQSPLNTKIDVSTDKKTIWWNVTGNVSDCQTVTIIFRAKVTGSSTCSGGCINYAYVHGYIYRYCTISDLVVNRTSTATVYAQANSPPYPPDVTGPENGVVGVEYTFKAMLTDPDNDQMYYTFSWGDGSDTGWLGPVSSGEVSRTHTYTSAGTYSVKVKAKDEHGAESAWTTYPLTIVTKAAKVEIKLKMFNIGSVKAVVTNTGEVDISNLEWAFTIVRNVTINLRDINVDGTGYITSLPIGGVETISSDTIGLFRMGRANVTVTCTKTGFITPTTVTAQAFIFGPIILVLS